MKHCLSCYRKIPNDAALCHYCGAPQAEKGFSKTTKILRCPNCLSYLYTETAGCQKCGYVSAEKKPKPFSLPLALIGALLMVFVVWQLGFLPFLPSPGRLTEDISKTGEALLPEALSNFQLVPLFGNEQDRIPISTPTVYGEQAATHETEAPANVQETEAASESFLTDSSSASVTIVPTIDALGESLMAGLPTVGAPVSAVQGGGSVSPTARASVIPNETPGAATGTSSPASGATEIPTLSPTPTLTPTIDTAFRCGEMRHQFESGQSGTLGTISGSIKVRSEPSTTSTQVTILRHGMTFILLDDEPVCDGTYMWIKVFLIDTNEEGWIVEADQRVYWVIPI